MDTNTPENTATSEAKAKSPRKAKAKPANRPIGKRSLNLSIPVEDYTRLATHSLMLDMTISDLVCKLAREHLREFHISRTPNREA